jgi:integrase
VVARLLRAGETRERQETSGTTDHEEAKQKLRRRLGEIADGKRQPGRLERRTVHEVLDLVRKDRADTGRVPPPGHLEALDQELGHIRALRLDREMLDDVVRKWKRDGATWATRKPKNPREPGKLRPLSGGTCNRYMGTLRRGFTLAREKWGLLTALTFPHEKETARGRYLPPDVFQRIVNAMPAGGARDVCELAYLLGVRKGQLRKTERANVVVKGIGTPRERWELQWRGDQTKAGKRDGVPHAVALTGRALDIVRRAYADERESCGFLFHTNRCSTWTHRHHPGDPCLGRLLWEWEQACADAGVPSGWKRGGFVFHNTRHSAVTNMNAAGIPDTVATTITGHRTLLTYKRYGIRQESVQRAALEKHEQYVQSITPSADETTGRKAG